MHPSDPRWKAASPVALSIGHPNPNVVMREHEGVTPRSYMAVANLNAILHACGEIASLLNENDELPAWVEDMLTTAKNSVGKARDYILSEKS
jgi:hypothetical protein